MFVPRHVFSQRPAPSVALSLMLAAATALTGCSSVDSVLQGDKVDYRSAAVKTKPLDIPPDLTQLSRDGRFQPQAGTVSASNFGQTSAASPAAAPAVVAPQAVGDMRIERSGNQRWLVTTQSPDQLWPQLQSFWQERGFNVVEDNPQSGVIETDWAENRAKLPQDVVRRTLGRVLDSLYETGERDKFRTRVERTPTGSEIYISHRGMEEVYVTPQRDQTRWQTRPSDPQLEADFLSRLMVSLGPKSEAGPAPGAAASAPITVATRARVLPGQATGAVMQVDDALDRAWRRVGLALDRSGFTVEDRDRAAGLYYVRYIDPAQAAKGEPGFFSRMFSGSSTPSAPARYRIALKADGEKTLVSVQSSQGAPEGGPVGQRIVGLLVDDLK